MPKRRRDERDDGPHEREEEEQRRLYLIFDDWPWGYTIRELDLSSSPAAAGSSPEHQHLSLPPPYICLGAPRRLPWLFTAVGTRIMAMHGVPGGCCLPMVDVRSRGVTFGPWKGHAHLPIYFPIGDHQLFALDTFAFRALSLNPLPRLENTSNCQWSWRDLPMPPLFSRHDVTSHAVHPDGRTILVSTATASYTFDTGAAAPAWKRHADSALPFTGRAHFVDDLNAFVGLSKDQQANFGRLCSCEAVAAIDGGGGTPAWKLGKEKLFSEDPAERHVGATLVYMGRTEFCLVQCVSIGDTSTPDQGQQLQPEELLDRLQKVLDALDQGQLLEVEGIIASPTKELNKDEVQYTYRLMTFSVGYDDDGHLTTGESCRLQCYKLPEEVSESFYHDPVAFWL